MVKVYYIDEESKSYESFEETASDFLPIVNHIGCAKKLLDKFPACRDAAQVRIKLEEAELWLANMAAHMEDEDGEE